MVAVVEQREDEGLVQEHPQESLPPVPRGLHRISKYLHLLFKTSPLGREFLSLTNLKMRLEIHLL